MLLFSFLPEKAERTLWKERWDVKGSLYHDGEILEEMFGQDSGWSL